MMNMTVLTTLIWLTFGNDTSSSEGGGLRINRSSTESSSPTVPGVATPVLSHSMSDGSDYWGPTSHAEAE
jgi:hypothetical protein